MWRDQLLKQWFGTRNRTLRRRQGKPSPRRFTRLNLERLEDRLTPSSPETLVFTTSAQTLTAGQPSAVMTVQLQDGSGNPVNAGSGGESFTLLAPSSGTFLDTSGKPISTLTISQGQSTASFEYEDTTAGTSNIQVSGSLFASQQETVQAAAASKVTLLDSLPQSLVTNEPSAPITVELTDKYGNVIQAGSGGLTFSLRSTSTGGKFLDVNDNPLPGPSVTIPQGFSEACFEYEDEQTGTPTLTVTADGFSATQQETINPTTSEILVTNANDSGDGSLRSAINAANSAPGSTIVIDATGTIDLLSALPTITADTNIIGPGADKLTIERSASATSDFSIFTISDYVDANSFSIAPAVVTITDVTVAKATATGIVNYGELTLKRVVVTDNVASSSFNAYSAPFGASTIASDAAGGIFNVGTSQAGDLGELTVLDSTIADNYSSEFAPGGISFVGNAPAAIINSTISGNVGGNNSSAGGLAALPVGLSFSADNSILIENSTIADNVTEGSGAGGIFGTEGSVTTLYDSIVAGNSSASLTNSAPTPNDVSGFGSGTIVSLGHNLVGVSNSSGFGSSDLVGSSASPLDAKLGALLANGGPTPTIALLPDSPAIDAGSSAGAPSADQIGNPRPQSGPIDIGAVQFTAPAPVFSITPGAVPAGAVGEAYNQIITASGGAGGTTVTYVPVGVIPAGLTFTANGNTLTIRGTPTAAGAVSFFVIASDGANDPPTAQQYTLIVNPALSLSNSTNAVPSAGTVGAIYSALLDGSGGSGNTTFTYKITSGAIPAGLSFQGGNSFSIFGTPTTAGTVSFTVTATDSGGGSVTSNYTLTIDPTNLPPGDVDVDGTQEYQQTINVSNGTSFPTPTYTITSGAIPAGLNFIANPGSLAIEGIPTAVGTVSFTVSATDGSGNTTTHDYTLTINPAVTLSPSTLPAATAGTAYNQAITANGGTGDKTLQYAVVSGAIPAGLTFTTKDNELDISGTPTAIGSVSFLVIATDSIGGSSADLSTFFDGSGPGFYTLSVSPILFNSSSLPPAVVGTAYNQNITASGGIGNLTVSHQITSGAIPSGLQFTTNDSQLSISGTPTAAGAVNFTVTATDSKGNTETQNYALVSSLGLPTITDLGVLPGETSSSASALNASGQVVGTSGLDAFLYSNGQLTDLGTLPGGLSSNANGINDSGEVVGVSGTDAFLYNNGQLTDLRTLPGDTNSSASGINDAGQVVGVSDAGFSVLATGIEHAFLYSNGTMTPLPTLPGAVGSGASAINASGQVVGASGNFYPLNGITHAFLYSNGQISDLGTLPGDISSVASALNASGQVVGTSTALLDTSILGLGGSPTGHAFLYSNGKMTDLGTLPGGTSSSANGINDSGQVVGESSLPSNVLNLSGPSSIEHAFLYSNGQMIDLNAYLPQNSGWVLTDATAINDSDQIVGTGTINGQTHAFLLNLNPVSLSPAPLPDGIVNTSYTQTIAASGGVGDKTLTYTITPGAIPSGLTFTPKTNELDISGTPTATGSVTFTVTATDSASTPESITQTYTLTIDAAAVPPSISGNPSNQSATVGQSATFTASASGTPTPTVQWQVSSDGGKTFSNINSATSTTLTLNNVTTATSGYEYQAVFTNSAGSVTTAAATLTVSQSAPPPPSASPPPPPVSSPPPLVSPPLAPILNAPPLLALFDQLLGAAETVNADGTVTETARLFGIPLLVSNFSSSGSLESVTLFGINVTILFELL